MIRNVYLYGDLAEKYGKVHRMAADSVAEVIQMMQANYQDFRKTILPGSFAILRGNSIDDYEENLTEEQLCMRYRKGDWHIIPEGCGAGGDGGVWQFVAGAVLTIAGIYFQQPWLIQLGVGLMLSGVATMLSPVPDTSDLSNEETDERASLIYNGGVNNIEQGGPIPIVYGNCMAGSILISSDVEVAEYADRTLGSPGDVRDFETEIP